MLKQKTYAYAISLIEKAVAILQDVIAAEGRKIVQIDEKVDQLLETRSEARALQDDAKAAIHGINAAEVLV